MIDESENALEQKLLSKIFDAEPTTDLDSLRAMADLAIEGTNLQKLNMPLFDLIKSVIVDADARIAKHIISAHSESDATKSEPHC